MIPLNECAEDDVIIVFKKGLQAFLTPMDGLFESRKVTPRQEASYPSDQDFSILFPKNNGFSLHLFGLQFKRWKNQGWDINLDQLKKLKRMGHVIGNGASA